MATFKEAYNNYKKFREGLKPEITKIIQSNSSILTEYVREQLFAGVNGHGKNLRPTYLNDPFFKSEDAGHWKNNAKGYMNWKYSIQPPRQSYLGYGPRSKETPNLIIRGDFYDSITAIPISDGVRIQSSGVSFGNEIEVKYGSIIFGISPNAKEHFYKNVFKPEFDKYISKFK